MSVKAGPLHYQGIVMDGVPNVYMFSLKNPDIPNKTLGVSHAPWYRGNTKKLHRFKTKVEVRISAETAQHVAEIVYIQGACASSVCVCVCVCVCAYNQH